MAASGLASRPRFPRTCLPLHTSTGANLATREAIRPFQQRRRQHPGHCPGAGHCLRGGVTVIILTAAIMEHFMQSHTMLRLSHDAVPSPHLRAEERKTTEAKVTASKGTQSQAAQRTPAPAPGTPPTACTSSQLDSLLALY